MKEKLHYTKKKQKRKELKKWLETLVYKPQIIIY